jgi:hypothetical protein
VRPGNDAIGTLRHVMLSNARGVITEIEQVRADDYVIRHHKSSADAARVLAAGPWIGFRYCDSHWSLVKTTGCLE